MNKDTTSVRLKQLMEERNLKQVDVLNACAPYCEKYHVKMNKSDISQYVSGKVEPNQNKLIVLGNALNVSEAWLMGLDVPMERPFFPLISSGRDKANQNCHSQNEQDLLEYFSKLNPAGEKEAVKRVKELIYVPDYTKNPENDLQLIVDNYAGTSLHVRTALPGQTSDQSYLEPNAAHHRSDIEATDEMRRHDDDLMNNDDLWK